MPLVKLEPLQHGIDDVWIDLVKVSSIWPLLGVPVRDVHGDTIPDRKTPARQITDLSEASVIGCRVNCEGRIFDLTVQPEDLAERVHAAVEAEHSQRWWGSPGASAPH